MSPMKRLPLRDRFASDQRGSIAVMTAVILVPVLIAATAAIDLSNAIRIKASLQAAADAGVLAAATALASGYGDSDKERIALDTFNANLSPELLKAFPVSPEVSRLPGAAGPNGCPGEYRSAPDQSHC